MNIIKYIRILANLRLFASYGILKKWYQQKIGGDEMNFGRKLHELDDVRGYEKDELMSNTEVHVSYNAKMHLTRIVSMGSTNIVKIKFCKMRGSSPTTIMHRDGDLPAILFLQANQNCKLSKAFYFKNGTPHRDENLGPQEIHFDYNGNISFTEYKVHGITHRTGNPAVIYSNTCYSFYRNGAIHRVEGPAVQDGKLYSWFVNGMPIDKSIFPIFRKNKQVNKIPITRELVMKAMLFDRDYGKFLNEKFQASCSSS